MNSNQRCKTFGNDQLFHALKTFNPNQMTFDPGEQKSQDRECSFYIFLEKPHFSEIKPNLVFCAKRCLFRSEIQNMGMNGFGPLMI